MKYNTQQLLNSAILETLEGRQMMSASPLGTATLHNGVLAVNGNTNQDTRVLIDLANNSQQLTVDISGARSSFAVSDVKQFTITTGNGADYVYINPAIDIPENISTGNGNDTVRGGGGNVTIIAGNGNDDLEGKGQNNSITAGSGNSYISGDKANNTLVAGNGNDTLVGAGQTDKLTVGNGNDVITVGDDRDTITVGTGHDTVTGGLRNTYLYTKGSTTGSLSSGSSTTTGTSGTTTGTSSTKTGTTSGSTSGSTSTGSSGSSSSSTGTTTTTTKSSSGTTTTGSSTSTGTTTTPTEPSTPPVTPVAPVTPVVPTLPVTSSTGSSSSVKPVAVITQLPGPRFTGLVVNVDALSSTLNSGTPITSNYQWNFGDPNTPYNEMTGYNAAHVYDTAGTYTITLTVTNSDGGVSTTTQKVTIAAAQRTQIYVDPTGGSDSNSGSENAPLQSLAAAFARIGNNTSILLRAGQTFYTNESMHVNGTNILIGSYGSGANPVIMRTLGNGLSTIASYSDVNGLTIQDITVNSPYSASTVAAANKIGLGGFFLGGSNICVRDCTFENVDDAINENGNPVGVLIQGNTAPLAIGLRGYMVWGQGSEQVIIGNYAANTTKEHIVRLVGLDMVNVQQNNFTNHDGKGCIEMHEGQYGWIVDNTVDGGDIRVGPLGLWGESASSQTDWVKIEDNQLTDTFIYVQSGTHHAMIDNNVIIRNGVQAIAISGVDSQGRTSMDITIENNTAIDTGSTGNFLDLGGYASGIVLKDNLWIAPKLVVGSYGTAPVYVDDSNLGCFTQISGNIWPSPITLGTYANGGINFVGTAMASSGYLTPAQWNAQSNVGNDEFENVSLNGSYQITADSLAVGAALKIAA